MWFIEAFDCFLTKMEIWLGSGLRRFFNPFLRPIGCMKMKNVHSIQNALIFSIVVIAVSLFIISLVVSFIPTFIESANDLFHDLNVKSFSFSVPGIFK